MPDNIVDTPDRTTSDSTSPNAVLAETTVTGQQTSHSVSISIGQVKAGDPKGMNLISTRYYEELVRVAAGLLRSKGPSTTCGGEDIANAALLSIYKGLVNGKFPGIESRKALWSLLCCMVQRKVARRIKHEKRPKRGGGRVRLESDLVRPGSDAATQGLDDFENDDRGSSRDDAAEALQQAREALPENLRETLDCMLEGLTQREAGKRQGCSQPTIQRREALILMTLRERFGES
jgi:RNA polymerase sigma factor (sigma-70 family)